MSEEKKECCCSSKGSVKTLSKIVIGIVLLLAGALACIRWLPALLILVKACIGPSLILIGLVFIAIAKE